MYNTLSKQDILKDLGSAIDETQGWDTDSPQAGLITPSAMAGVKDTWSNPTETQWANENIFPLPRHQSEAKIQDEEASLVDPITSPATSDAKDIQSSPTETSLVDHITVPSAELNTKTWKDLLTTQATSPAKDTEMNKDLPIAWAISLAELESQVTPTTGSMDESAGLPTLSGHQLKKDRVYQL